MSIAFLCGQCSKRITVMDHKAGAEHTCPGCKTRLIVPAPAVDDDAPRRRAAPPRKRRAGTGKLGTGKLGTGKLGTGKLGKSRAGTSRLGARASAGRAGTGRGGRAPSRKRIPAHTRERPSDEAPPPEADGDEGVQGEGAVKAPVKRRRKAVGKPRGAANAGGGSGEGGSNSAQVRNAILGGAGFLVFALVFYFVGGKGSYDRAFEKVQVGMTRAQVIDIMGEPEGELDVEVAGVQVTSLVFGLGHRRRRSSRTTYHVYVVVIDQTGHVIHKEYRREED